MKRLYVVIAMLLLSGCEVQQKINLPDCKQGQTADFVIYDEALPDGSRIAAYHRTLRCAEGKWNDLEEFRYGVKR